MSTLDLPLDAYMGYISVLPIVSGTDSTLVNSFKIDVLAKVSVRGRNIQLMYCAYYFYTKALGYGIITSSSNEREVIRLCKSWLHRYLSGDSSSSSEKNLIVYLGGSYYKNIISKQSTIILDIVRYMSIILFSTPIELSVEEANVNEDITNKNIHEDMTNEYAELGDCDDDSDDYQ